MKKCLRSYVIAFACISFLSGCGTIMGWADDLGEHLPVYGERCEHWQCFTDSGKAASEYKKQQRQRPAENMATEAQASSTKEASPAPTAKPAQKPTGDVNTNPFDHYKP